MSIIDKFLAKVLPSCRRYAKEAADDIEEHRKRIKALEDAIAKAFADEAQSGAPKKEVGHAASG